MFVSGAVQTYAPVHETTHRPRPSGRKRTCVPCARSMQAPRPKRERAQGPAWRAARGRAPVQVQLGARAARLQLRQRPGQAGEHPQDQRAIQDGDRQHLAARGGAQLQGRVG